MVVKTKLKKPVKRIKKTAGKKKVSASLKKRRIVAKKVSKKSSAKKSHKGKRKIIALKLRKPKRNPIIEPRPEAAWQSKATFNPTALYADGKIHIIYRAIGDNDMSVLGYANSHDGVNISERHDEVAYQHETGKKKKNNKKLPPIIYGSGGGWGGGSEDPRITEIEGNIYLLYTAFDGWGSVRVAMNSISLDDFLSKKWRWNEPVLISPPGEIHKNWVLFPKKINGKYAILHSISPKISIDYFDDLDELDGNKYVKSIHQGSPLWQKRDRGVRGVGPAPLETKHGWLVMYHAMEQGDPGKYKLWAMILDKKNPEKVLYRSIKPILEPDQGYENNGFKWGVVYSCGAVIKEDTLFVYYGGADMVTCVASADLKKFLNELVTMKEPKLSRRARAAA